MEVLFFILWAFGAYIAYIAFSVEDFGFSKRGQLLASLFWPVFTIAMLVVK